MRIEILGWASIRECTLRPCDPVRVSDTSLTVYRLDFDIERYRHLGFDCDDPPLHLYALEPRAGAEWPVPRVCAGGTATEDPDVWELAGAFAPVMRRATADQLGDLLTPSDELVPVVFEATRERLLAVKVRRVVDCLDEQASVLGPLALTLVFDADRVPTGGLFKVPQLQQTETFVAEGPEEPSFRSRIAHLRLSGITFERVWAHLTGAEPVNLVRF
jgi:hypothetical protein